jgi:hypothetical protein
VLVFGIPNGGDENEQLRVLAHSKCNVGPRQPSQEWKLTTVTFPWGDETIGTSRVSHVGPSELSAHDLVGREREAGADRVDADEFLSKMLHDDDEPVGVPASELFEEGEKVGLSKITLRRARKRLGVNATQRGRRWWWHIGALQKFRCSDAPPDHLNPENGQEPPANGAAEPNPSGDHQVLTEQGDHLTLDVSNGHRPKHTAEDFAAVEPYAPAGPEDDEDDREGWRQR